jgi:hypothetical protein
MKKEEIKVGMDVVINGFYNKSFPIVAIEDDNAIVSGFFSDALKIAQTIKIPLNTFIEGNVEDAKFRLKDAVKYKDTILVSNDNQTWYIRSFSSYGNTYGSVYTILQMDDADVRDDISIGSDGFTDQSEVYWKFYKRIVFLK